MDIQSLVVSLPALMMAVVLHEYAHGWMAFKMGDTTAYKEGRLTINPIPHIDPFGTILLPAILMLLGSPILFGWAKPVPINPLNFRDLRKGTFLVSVAGIGMNFLLAVLFGVLYRLIDSGYLDFMGSSILVPLAIFSAKSVFINLVLAIFNAVPIPPLDGSRAVMSFLSFRHWELFYRFEVYGFLVISLLLFTGVLQKIIYPPLILLYSIILGA
ncbi:peptidase M50 [Thermocrinis albus DSM 14484]|uniref:Peptidase M50 n=1 Tax=Thermocrinis albus (strain DSM 14484 / JCM 11386 / HI 11/12) TaxID=638303 RepID=D3SMA3_THEAH|nr:site-2 protease family protein [Thermocrinis albus]ADC89883.1 peptidase M50 [Thermocrinis albus DSM 14484]